MKLIAVIESATRSIDPMLPMAAFRSINDIKAASLQFQRFLATLVNVMAMLAGLLTTLGIYGLIANLVRSGPRNWESAWRWDRREPGSGNRAAAGADWVMAGSPWEAAAAFALGGFLAASCGACSQAIR